MLPIRTPRSPLRAGVGMREVVGGASGLLSPPGWGAPSPQGRAQGGLHCHPTGGPKPGLPTRHGDWMCPTEDMGHGSRRRPVGCAGEQFDSIVSREHTHCSRLLTPIFPSLFIVFKIWQVALAPDATVARSPRVPWTTDHRCRPVEPAALVLNVLHVYACVPWSLPVPFPSPSVNVSR